jgi:tRNA(Ile)-lysidine synthase
LDFHLVVAHFDHGIRGESGREDARWVKKLAGELGYKLIEGNAALAAGKGERHNLEQAARQARYEFLAEAARKSKACSVLTAHTLDDQAETFLLRLLRGSGAVGLGSINPERLLVEGSDVRLLRPLLEWARRADTEAFCLARGVEFRRDEMNEDETFARVRVRRRLLPLLESFNPKAAETLSRTARLLREEAAAIDFLARRLLDEATAVAQYGDGNQADQTRALTIDSLAAAPEALRRRALRRWIAEERGNLRRVELVHILAIEKLLNGTRGGRIAELPGGARVERRKGKIFFRKEAK